MKTIIALFAAATVAACGRPVDECAPGAPCPVSESPLEQQCDRASFDQLPPGVEPDADMISDCVNDLGECQAHCHSLGGDVSALKWHGYAEADCVCTAN